jgi:hypothetical protein
VTYNVAVPRVSWDFLALHIKTLVPYFGNADLCHVGVSVSVYEELWRGFGAEVNGGLSVNSVLLESVTGRSYGAVFRVGGQLIGLNASHDDLAVPYWGWVRQCGH